MAGSLTILDILLLKLTATVELSRSQLLQRTMDRPRRMEMDYSLKNIPIHSKDTYRKRLIEKVESVVRRMRWKAFFFLNGSSEETTDSQRHGFRSKKTPPQVKEMIGFEEDLTRMIENIQFRNVNEPFQRKLREAVRSITKTDDIIVKADKTKHVYHMSKDQYSKLLQDNVTKNYKLAPDATFAQINLEAKKLAEKLDLGDRMETMAETEAFITLKDHKARFINDLPCRLINPAKSEVGVISKAILDRITRSVQEATSVNLWRNTASVIDWFKSIPQKKSCCFVSFDVVEFYPSITEALLEEALAFASGFVEIQDDEKAIIMHARKSLLFKDGKTWMKKRKEGMFDVTMGSYDGAEVCQLVGAFLLNKLSKLVEKSSIGLYRDDGLGVLRNATGRSADKLRKDVIGVFKSFGLRVTIEVNLKVVNFLDATLDLDNAKYGPYRKPDDNPLFLDKGSNHPPVILQNLPNAIGRRISSLCADPGTFSEAAPLYNHALAKSGFKQEIEFTTEDAKQKKTRRRNIIWFNPPFCKSVKTKVGAIFLRLINKHFPKSSSLAKIFNRSTIKVSYCCLPNIACIIAGHNKKKLEEQTADEQCNCRVKTDCPLNGQCQASSVVYEATVTSNNDKKTYIGLSETSFKTRYANHRTSFKHERYRNSTELSKYLWRLKEEGKEFNLEWKIVERARAYSTVGKRCGLCLAEKHRIITSDKAENINKRAELVSKCRHANKFSLANFAGVT